MNHYYQVVLYCSMTKFLGGTILNIKTWKLYIFSSICFLFVAIMNLIEKKYLLGGPFLFLGALYIYLSITYYKKDNKSNKK